MPKKLTLEQALDKFSDVGWVLIGEYKGSYRKTMVECPLCGKHFETMPSAIFNRNTKSCGCYKSKICSEKQYRGGKYLTATEFKSIRQSAQRRNLQFDITIQDVEDIYELQNKRCILQD